MITEIPIAGLPLVAFISELGCVFVPDDPDLLTVARTDLAAQLAEASQTKEQAK
jgi:hypothetical protein